MVPVVFGRRSETSGGSVPRVNVIAIVVLLGSVVLGVVGTIAAGNPIPLIAMIPVWLFRRRNRAPGATAK